MSSAVWPPIAAHDRQAEEQASLVRHATATLSILC